MARKRKRHRLLVQVRFKVPRTVHPEKLAQQIREALDNGSALPHGVEMAKIDWSHPEDADTGWKHGTRKDLENLLEVVGGTPEAATVSIEPSGSHVEQVKRERRGYGYTYHRLDGRFASRSYRERYPARVTRHRHYAVRYDYDEVEVPDFEIMVDYDY